jgi:pilus assembly protein CpaE
MLTAGIASGDSNSAGQLLAALQQTGLVGSVRQWTVPMEQLPDVSETVPDVVFLDLARDTDAFFVLAAHLRRIRPAVRLIACSATNPPNHQLLLDAMRSGVQDFVSKPVLLDELIDILKRVHTEGPSERRAPEKLIVIMGSKGGVGTTTVAVNLAVQMATHARKKTVILDFARPLGNVHLLLDLHPRFGLRDAVENLNRLDTHFFSGLLTPHKTKVEILGGALHPEEWQKIPVAPMERVVNVAQATADTVLLDMGTQFSSDWSTILSSARMIMVVAEANVPSLWTLERRVLALTGWGIDPEKIRVVVNRWHKGEDEVLKSIEKNIKRPVFATLPNDYRKASAAFNLGTPLLENHNNILSNRYRQLAAQLAGMDQVTPGGDAAKRGIGGFFSFPTKR